MKTRCYFIFLWLCFAPYAYGQINWLSLDICSDYYLALFAQKSDDIALTRQSQSLALTFGENTQFHKNQREEIYRLKPQNILYTDLASPAFISNLSQQGFSLQKWPWPKNKADLKEFYQNLSQQFHHPKKWESIAPLFSAPSFAASSQKIALMGSGGFIVGQNTHYDIFFEALSMVNYYPKKGYGKLSWEEIFQNPPDVIVTFNLEPKGTSLGDDFWKHPVLSKLDIPIIDISEYVMICPNHELIKAAQKVKDVLP